MASVQKIVPNLWFDGNAKEAVDYYVSVFPDSSVLSTVNYPTEGLADFQQGLAGQVLTIEFTLFGQRFLAINAGSEFKFNEAVSFMINCENQEEIDYYWEKLSHSSENEQCGWCKDKFGLSWQVTPTNIDQRMTGPDGAYNPKAFAAMMEMKKLDIAALEAATKE